MIKLIKRFWRYHFGGAETWETDAQFARRVMISGISTLIMIVLGAILIYAGLVMGLAL